MARYLNGGKLDQFFVLAACRNENVAGVQKLEEVPVNQSKNIFKMFSSAYR